jgi:outer membrane protein assembly factor BamB
VISPYDLATGEAAWTWTGEGPAYGSPVLLTVAGTKQLVTLTQRSLVGIGLADGKLLWQVPFRSRLNAETPIVDGTTVICSGPPAGTAALKIEKKGDGFAAIQLWKKDQAFYQNQTPVLKDGLLFGFSINRSFCCMDAKTGEVLWTDKTQRSPGGAVLDAGSVLLALTSDAQLIAFKPSNKEYTELARYKVADSPTWAYPIIAGSRVFVKDRDTVTLWTME